MSRSLFLVIVNSVLCRRFNLNTRVLAGQPLSPVEMESVYLGTLDRWRAGGVLRITAPLLFAGKWFISDIIISQMVIRDIELSVVLRTLLNR